MPLMAPPVPNKPALKPDKTPPKMAFLLDALMINSLKIKKIRLSTIKNPPKK